MKRSLGIVLAFLVLAGCSTRRTAQGFRAVLNPNCLTAPIVMEHCNFSTDPPQCRKVQLKYRRGCAQIQLKSPSEHPAE